MKIYLLSIFLIVIKLVVAQSEQYYTQSVTGTKGLVMIPTARFGQDREFNFSMYSLTKEQAFLPFKAEPVGEKMYSLSVNFLPFAEAIISVTRPNNIDEHPWGIGDRSVKGRILIFREKRKMPAIVIGLHDVMSVNHYQSAAYLVSSKLFKLNSSFSLDSHLGYGLAIDKKPFSNLDIFEDASPFISGIFFGANIIFKNTADFSIEYDTEKINIGASCLLLNHFGAQFSLLDFNNPSLGLFFRHRLGDPLFGKDHRNKIQSFFGKD